MENQRKVTRNYRTELEDYLKRISPVRTGNLRNSIEVTSQGEDLLMNAIHYAKYVLPKHINDSELNEILEDYAGNLINAMWDDMNNNIK